MLAGIAPIAAPLAVVAQDAAEFKVYRLTKSTPSEARTMLMELLDADTDPRSAGTLDAAAALLRLAIEEIAANQGRG